MKRTLSTMVILGAALTLTPTSASARPQAGQDGFSWHMSVGRGRLGAQVMGLNDDLRLHYGAPRGAGILVSGVEEGSPADGAGLQVGDVIVSVAGTKIGDAKDVGQALSGKKEGDVVPVVVVRNHISTQLMATLDADVSERYEAWDMRGHGSPGLSPRMLRRFARPFAQGGRPAPPLPPGGDEVVPDDDLGDWMAPFDDMARRMQRSMGGDATSRAILDRLEAIERRLDAIEKKQP